MSKSKTHQATFSGTGILNITSDNMFKSIELSVMRKMLQEEVQLKIDASKLLEIEGAGMAVLP